MARRQTVPLADVRAPTFVDDQMTQAEVQAGAPEVQNAEDLVSIIASQLRLAQGSRGWLQPPTPGQATTGTIDLRRTVVATELLGGARDGSNLVFTTARAFLAPTLTVYMNGASLVYGPEADYIALESGGTGTGYDTVKLTGALAPVSRDRLTASYIRAV